MVYLPLDEMDEEPYHVSPPIGRHLEHHQVVVVEDAPEVRGVGETAFQI